MNDNTDVKNQDSIVFLPEDEVLKKELSLSEPATIKADVDVVDPEIKKQAETIAERLFTIDPKDMEVANDNKAAVETLGLEVQRKSSQQSDMLKEQIHVISSRSEDGGQVAKSLVDLKMQVEALDPVNFDFEPGFVSRTLGWIPIIGTPIKRYFTRYESSQTVLAAISDSLHKGEKQLDRDNVTLTNDQKTLNEINKQLEKVVLIGQTVDKMLEDKIFNGNIDNARLKFLQEEIQFPLRQRNQDLQQSMVVHQQGILAMELLIRTNKELIRGVGRSLNVTMNALEVAVTVATGAYHQKIVLDKIVGLKKTTEDLIGNTAKMLRETVAETNKLASSTALDMTVLKQSFADIKAALDDVATFRKDALPKLASNILELDKMTKDQDETIKKLDDGNKVSSALIIDP